jgi:hypothetical protein
MLLPKEIAIKHLNEARNLIDHALTLIGGCAHISDGAVYFIHPKDKDFITGEQVYKCKLCLEMYK